MGTTMCVCSFCPVGLSGHNCTIASVSSFVPRSWNRRSSRLLGRWPKDDNILTSAFVLPAPGVEPLYIPPMSYGVWYGDALAARFSYRIDVYGRCFVGLVVSPSFRGRGFGRSILDGCIARVVADYSLSSVWCSIADANIASRRLFARSGFVAQETSDWRNLPDGFPVDVLTSLPVMTWRLWPAGLLYRFFVLS